MTVKTSRTHLICQVSNALHHFLNNVFADLVSHDVLEVRHDNFIDESFDILWKGFLDWKACIPLKFFVRILHTFRESQHSDSNLSQSEAGVIANILMDVLANVKHCFTNSLQMRLHQATAVKAKVPQGVNSSNLLIDSFQIHHDMIMVMVIIRVKIKLILILCDVNLDDLIGSG